MAIGGEDGAGVGLSVGWGVSVGFGSPDPPGPPGLSTSEPSRSAPVAAVFSRSTFTPMDQAVGSS